MTATLSEHDATAPASSQLYILTIATRCCRCNSATLHYGCQRPTLRKWQTDGLTDYLAIGLLTRSDQWHHTHTYKTWIFNTYKPMPYWSAPSTT